MTQQARLTSIQLRIVCLAFACYIAIGAQSALLGVAWSGPPGVTYLRETFGQPLDAVALLLASGTLGYFIAGGSGGRAVSRFGVGVSIAIGMVMSALALFSYTIVPSWAFAIGSAFGLGFGCGLLDAAVNIYFAANHGSRLMNWLHASFGVGATLGPFIMSSSLLQTGSWQAGYVTTAMLQGCCAAFALALRNRWSMPSLNTQTTETSPRGLDTFRLAPVYTSIGIFICYTGVEMSIGQWAYPLFAEARNIPERQASTWLSVYWGAFTLGRIGFGFVGDHVPIAGILRGCLTAALVAGGFLVWNPFANAGLVSLALFGVAIAPIWAMLMLNTQRQVGAVHAPNAIGFQIAGAALGFGLLPGLAGLIARRSGLEWIPWLLILLVILMFALFEWNQHSNKAERLSAR